MKSEVIDFIRNSVYYISGELESTSSIAQDLGIDGDDAKELIELFVEKFKLDTTNFSFEKYFLKEGWNLFGIPKIIAQIKGLEYIEKGNYSIKVKDLEDWLERGYWIDPDVGSL